MKKADQVIGGMMDCHTNKDTDYRQDSLSLTYNLFETLYRLRIIPADIQEMQLSNEGVYTVFYKENWVK